MAGYQRLSNELRDGDKVQLSWLRKGKVHARSVKAVPRPVELAADLDIIYDAVPFRGGLLRTITRKPKGRSGMPAILLIPGYGCGSIDNFSTGYNGHLIKEWLLQGYAVVTIEKSGMGDSYHCLPCTQVDLQTDIESFEAGYQYMEQLDFVDKRALFIWGHSMGGVIAPEIAKRHHPRGVMVYGTVFRPWSEFLLEMHRVQKPLDSLSYQQTERFTRLIHKVYYEFFIQKRSPAELYTNPEYKDIVASELEYKPGSNNLWGRHWRFWQQLDSLDLSVSWAQLTCPVLVMNGSSDHEQCAAIEPILIEQTVNEAHPGNATRRELPGVDHFMMSSADYPEAVRNFKDRAYLKGNFNYRVSEETIRWMALILAKS
jgi:pimeloyl-ACP methyl ester carboxylesterase